MPSHRLPSQGGERASGPWRRPSWFPRARDLSDGVSILSLIFLPASDVGPHLGKLSKLARGPDGSSRIYSLRCRILCNRPCSLHIQLLSRFWQLLRSFILLLTLIRQISEDCSHKKMMKPFIVDFFQNYKILDPHFFSKSKFIKLFLQIRQAGYSRWDRLHNWKGYFCISY